MQTNISWIRISWIRNLAGAAAALFALTGAQALAADMPLKALTPVSGWNWTGFYAGGDVGYAFGTSAGTDLDAARIPGTGPAYSFAANGALGGAFLGGQMQWRQIVLGIEADYQAANPSGNSGPLAVGATSYAISSKLTSYDSVRGRLGYASGPWLFFVTGGWASAQWATYYGFNGASSPFAANNANQQGWAGGLGLNYALSPHMFLTAEYRYTALNGASFTNSAVNTSEVGNTFKINDVRLGVGYKF
jgi:outer membrane immunogenic protein